MIRHFVTSPKNHWKLISKLLCGSLLALLVSTAPLAKPSGPDGVALSQPLVVKWRYTTDQISNLTPAADKTTIFVPLAGGTLMALNAPDGKLLWKAESGGDFSAAPITDERCVFSATR